MTDRDDLAQTLRDQQPNAKNAATEYNQLWDKAADALTDQEGEIQRLQRALSFWLPNVPVDDEEIADRAGDDSFLLIGYDGEDEPSAQDRKWITLRAPPAASKPQHSMMEPDDSPQAPLE